MKRFLLLFIGVLGIAYSSYAQPRPKLVVGIVVDQMRWDYLYRYYNHYGNDGFKRLMTGFNCQQAMINYLPSFTAPGHTCIYTGSVPAIHGIAGNEWFEDGKFVYCTDDKTVQPVGGSKKWGQMSPRNLLTTTVTDELRLATNFRSRTFGVSLKDRSSILPAGHLANGAYWFDDSTGNFFSSTYYGQALPQWLVDFNAKRLPDSLLSQDWVLRDELNAYKGSLPDNSRYEGKFSRDEPAVTFPHSAKYFMGKGDLKYNTLRKLPAGNWITLQLARACIRANELGTKADPDFLAVSLSATDYAAHQFGPNALEMEDIYIRLDDELAKFLRYLDKHVGAGEYTVFLTADHGAAHNADFLTDRNVPALNEYESTLRDELNYFLKRSTGKDTLIRSLENYQVYLSEMTGNDMAFDARFTLKMQIRALLERRPEVAYTIDMEMNGVNRAPEPIYTMAINGYYRPRSGAIQIIFKPGYYMGYAPTGTTHGTWNPYDTHIPLLFYGWGINHGETYREVHMTDIAATVAALLHIQMPNGCVGKVIEQVIR